MKSKNIIVALAAILFATNAQAQIKVYSATGKVDIGLEPPVGINNDPLNALSAHIYGANGDLRTGSKLAFGDFGQYDRYGWNVFVGEYGNDDADQLWLHGKKGMYLTYGRGDDIIGYYDVAAGNKFTFNCDVYSYGIMLASDARFKTNVTKVDHALENILKMDGVSYNLLPHVIADAQKKNAGNETGKPDQGTGKPMTAKEQKDKALFDALGKQQQQPGPKRLGFIAQDVKKIFPDLVKQDSSNYMYVDYIGLIPVLVEAMKDQQNIIDAQNEKIKKIESVMSALEDKINNCCNASNSKVTDGVTATSASSFLYQNQPNPFTVKTEVKYFLADNVKSATIYIYNMQGTLIKSYPVSGHGSGSITINGGELQAGIYIYALVADGKEIDTKKMSLVK